MWSVPPESLPTMQKNIYILYIHQLQQSCRRIAAEPRAAPALRAVDPPIILQRWKEKRREKQKLRNVLPWKTRARCTVVDRTSCAVGRGHRGFVRKVAKGSLRKPLDELILCKSCCLKRQTYNHTERKDSWILFFRKNAFIIQKAATATAELCSELVI